MDGLTVDPPAIATGAMPSADERRIALDERRAELEAQRLALDRSFSKLWAPLILPALLSLTTVGVTKVVTDAQTARAANAQEELTKRQALDAARQRELENGRNAVSLYFDKVDLRRKDDMTPGEQGRFVADMQLIEAVSGSRAVGDILRKRWLEMNRTAGGASAGPGEANVAAVKPDSPDLIQAPPDNRYVASQFIAFPQAPQARDTRDVARLTDALVALRFDVQPVQRIAPGRSPRLNQLRYYRADQKAFAIRIAAELGRRLCMTVNPVWIGGGRLPNGVLEFWLGGGAEAASAANCPAG